MSKFYFAMVTAVAALLPASAAVPAHQPVKIRQVSYAAPHVKAPLLRSANPSKIKPADSPEYRLYESFENVTGSPIAAPMAYGMPAGWTTDALLDRNNLGPNGELPTCWYTANSNYTYGAFEGDYVAVSPALSNVEAQATIFSPEFTPDAHDELNLTVMYQPMRLFKGFNAWIKNEVNEYIDGEDGIILKRECNENFQILISTDGGNSWSILHDAFETFKDKGYWEMYDNHHSLVWETFTFDLNPYADSPVQIAVKHFNYGEGGGICLDLVTVGAPQVETSYYPVDPAYFWGFSKSMEAYAGFMAAPMYTPVSFASDDWQSTLSWESPDPENPGSTITGEGDLFSVTYLPDYEKYGENMSYTQYDYPTLTATRENALPGTYNYGEDFAFGQGVVLATGRAALFDRETNQMVDEMNFGLTNADPARGISILTFDGIGTPVFGYSGDAKSVWTSHYFGGDFSEEDYAKCTAIFNYYYPIEGQPIVIHGVRVFGIGKFISDEAAEATRFTLEATRLNDEFVPTETLRTATLTGAQAIVLDYDEYVYPYMVFDFKFDEPLVFEDFNMVIRFSGFDSENLTYFAPMQSDLPFDYMCYAFGEVEVYAPSINNLPPTTTFVPSANFKGDFGDAMSAFTFSLDAEMPWLKADEHTFEASEGETAHTFTLDSWHHTDNLTITANTPDGTLPAWFSRCELAGTKRGATLSIDTRTGSGEQCVLTVKGPGVSRSFTVKQAVSAGIDAIEAEAIGDTTEHFDLLGRPMAPEAKGIHVTSKGKYISK